VALLEQLPDFGMSVFGAGLAGSGPICVSAGTDRLDAKESAKVIALAKICINTNILPMRAGKLKTFEIAASGGFQLTDHLSDLDASFIPGKN